MATSVKQTCSPAAPGQSPWIFWRLLVYSAWVYSLPPLAPPLSKELPSYTQLHHQDASAGSCWVALLQTEPPSAFPESTCLFFILLHSSLCSALCLSENESTLGIHSHAFRWNQTRQIQVFFKKKFWFTFQKQRKSTIQNLDLIFLCGMPGLR